MIVNKRVIRRLVKRKEEGAGCSATNMSDIEDEPPSVLLPCTICSRTFKPEVLERHVKVCEKTASKKRRVFDSFKNRVSGTELEEFLGPAPLPGQVQKRPAKSPVKKKNPSKWKETHENLIAVLRAARGVNPPPEAIVDVSKHGVNEQCPSCNRFFGPRAYDRHVEFCKEKTARIKATPSKVSQAQERLEARTKYRAPLSVKPKLTTKEKYSPMLTRKESTETCAMTSTNSKTSPPIPTSNRAAKSSNTNFTKSNMSRSMERQRSVSPKKNVISNSKSTNKNDFSAIKSSNQPKLKENLKEPEVLRPKTGTKNTASEKNRSCTVKISQPEDETLNKLFKWKQKTKDKVGDVPSDNESISTCESGSNDNSFQKIGKSKNKFSHFENTRKTSQKVIGKIKLDEKDLDDEKLVSPGHRSNLGSKNKEKILEDGAKFGKKSSKQQKPQINDLSVNDESFGIFVAPCGRPQSSASFPTSVKISPEKINEKPKVPVKKKKIKNLDDYDQHTETSEDFPKKKFGRLKSEIINPIEKDPPEPSSSPPFSDVFPSVPIEKETKRKKIEKTSNSKIPKPKFCGVLDKDNEENLVKSRPETNQKEERQDELEGESSYCPKKTLPKTDEEEKEKIKAKAKRWRNISEMTNEDLLHMTEDFDLGIEEESQELSESAIWEIAAEQFLKSEESVQSTSVISMDSLNENCPKTMTNLGETEKQGDDFIVLHVADPSKLDENDASMKLSLSEPCFPSASTGARCMSKLKKSNDVVVFSSSPGEIEKRRRVRKFYGKHMKKLFTNVPSLVLGMREKTFLANDMPKAKRRKLSQNEGLNSGCDLNALISDLLDNFPNVTSEEKKKKLMESLMNRKEKVCKWYITGDFHLNFLEEFRISLEDDLNELKNLSLGKKRPKKSFTKKFKMKKYREMKELKVSGSKNSAWTEKPVEKCSSNKKFEYFEINLDEDLNESKKPNPKAKREFEKNAKKKGCENIDSDAVKNVPEKKFQCFEISNNTEEKSKRNNHLAERQNADFPSGKVQLTSSRENSKEKAFMRANQSPTCNRNLTDFDENNSVTPVFNCKNAEESLATDVEKIKKNQTASAPRETNHVSLKKSNKIKSREVNDSFQPFSNQSGSLENIEEVDEEEEKAAKDGKVATNRDEIEIEDFIVFRPDTTKLLSKKEICLDELFPKLKKTETVRMGEYSTTAIRLDYTADSVYDLKSNVEKNLSDFQQMSNRNIANRMLQKRPKKLTSHLPQIPCRNNNNAAEDKKENSMVSLIKLWKNKKGNASCGDGEFKDLGGPVKAAFTHKGKLEPLSPKNPFQIKSNISDLYEPFKQAERQMLALLSWPSTTDIKMAKDVSPKTKRNFNSPTNLHTSSASAFSKYPSDKTHKTRDKNLKGSLENFKNNMIESYVNEDSTRTPTSKKTNGRFEKPTYGCADDWEKIFEKHFDLNRNEMTNKNTKSVKSTLDEFLKNSKTNNLGTGNVKSDGHTEDRIRTPLKNRNNLSDNNSIIEEILYTSTPKRNSKTNNQNKTFDLNQNSQASSEKSSEGLNINTVLDPDERFDRTDENLKNRNSGISLSGLSFCSQISDSTLADEVISNLEIVGKAAAAAAVSRTPRRKYARSQSVFEERNRMLFAKTYDPSGTSSDEENVAKESPKKIYDQPGTKKSSPPRNPCPKPIPSNFYRSQSLFDGRGKGDGDHTDEADRMSSPENNRNRKVKMSGDSAYSSLNRRSPRQHMQKSIAQASHEDKLSSGESDTSQPIIDVDHNQKKKGKPVKMSKFCHECGSKYPVAIAKFCCECGVRRLVI